MKAGRRNITISSKDKLIFPERGITKNDLAEYYYAVAEYMLPHIADHPLMLQRFPNGISKGGFYQKEASDYFPEWINTVTVPKENGEVKHVLCNNAATLVYLANQAVVTIHSWLSRADAIDCPDKLIIDLDPPSDDFDTVRSAAFLIKDFADGLDITTFPMTTGSSGVHIVIPLDRKADFATVRGIANHIADLLQARHPDVFTTERLKKKRGGKIYLDMQRNAYAQTAVAPYSLRATPEASVAAPVIWEELADRAVQARTYTISNVLSRLSDTGDPWKGIRRRAISVHTLAGKVSAMA